MKLILIKLQNYTHHWISLVNVIVFETPTYKINKDCYMPGIRYYFIQIKLYTYLDYLFRKM